MFQPELTSLRPLHLCLLLCACSCVCGPHQEEGVLDVALERQLRELRFLKALRAALIVQDLADTAIALNDIRGEQKS